MLRFTIPGYLYLFVSVICCCCSAPAGQSKKLSEFHMLPGRDSVVLRTDFQQYFKSCGVQGSIAVYDLEKQLWILSDGVDTKLASLPASTFKIMNLLVLLETKTIADENVVVKWTGNIDTVKYGYRPDIYRDMTVKEAFTVSAGWVFVELAKKAGRPAYKKYLDACNYGNGDLSHTDVDFWNFGNFAISPVNQVEFLEKLYQGTFPFSKRNMEIVKQVMIAEQKSQYVLRAKTGWTRDKGMNTGWWVGYLEQKGNVYFFATRLLQDRKWNTPQFGECRKTITKQVLGNLEVLQ